MIGFSIRLFSCMRFALLAFTCLVVLSSKKEHSCPLEEQQRDLFLTQAFIGDRASANDVGFDCAYARTLHIPRLRLPCLAHVASTYQGRSYASVSDDMSGIIGMSIAVSNAGELTALRKCIVNLLLEPGVVRIHNAICQNTFYQQIVAFQTKSVKTLEFSC